MMTTVTLEGFRELEQALMELPRATGKNVLKRIAKGALEPMADDAATNAPDRTGKLAFSVVVSDKRTRRAKRQVPGLRSDEGVQMFMGPSGGLGALQYAAFDEFGTVDTPAFGFMRSAWDAGAMPALDFVKDNLGDEIAKAAARVAKRRARAG